TAAVDGGSVANSSATPGTLNAPFTPSLPPPPTGLHPEQTYSGKFVLSVDGKGYGASCGTIRVQKPAGATVFAAWMAGATIPTSTTINNGDITINGTGVTWSESIASSIGGNNVWGEVTSIVKPIVDVAAAGIVNLTVCEGNKTDDIDGEVLAVVFADASLTRNNTIVLLFGTQQTTGDDFSVDVANPIDKTDAALKIDMSLGIGYSF